VNEFKLKIHKVKEEVDDKIKPEIKNLLDNYEQLETIDSTADEKKLMDLNKQCLLYTNQLINSLVALDSIVGEGAEQVREQRKEEVHQIQTLLSQVDDIQKKLKGIQDKMITEKQKQQQEQEQEQEEKKSRR